jgi:hypothetical protein
VPVTPPVKVAVIVAPGQMLVVGVITIVGSAVNVTVIAFVAWQPLVSLSAATVYVAVL